MKGIQTFLFVFLDISKNMFLLILDTEEGRGIERETLISCPLFTPYWGASPNPCTLIRNQTEDLWVYIYPILEKPSPLSLATQWLE